MSLVNNSTASSNSNSTPPTPSFLSHPSSLTSLSGLDQNHHQTTIQLQLDSSNLVFRSFTGDEANSSAVVLSGSVTVRLAESTSLKYITLILRAVARLDYLDLLNGKRYRQDHTIFAYQAQFLPLCSDSTHTHTLQAGTHLFPFSLRLPPGLPASLRTFSGSGSIYYKLKAVASRAGFLASSKWETKHLLRVSRSFHPDSLEWSQTLDIENTWPGKISYEISLPRKAFAAGEKIPVSVKFIPLTKGVRVTSLVITIKEHVTLIAKSGNPPHVENRDVAEYLYNFNEPITTQPTSSSPRTNPNPGPLTSTDLGLLARRLQAVSLRNSNQSNNRSRATSLSETTNTALHITNQEILTGDLEKTFNITLPAITTPSHQIPPITVNHKLRFSAFISNPDGHTSELRCALPLCVMAAELLQETLMAANGSGTNSLVFSPSGTLDTTAAQTQTELPSYQEHLRDRLAPIASAASRPALIAAPWSLATTPAGSPPCSPLGLRRSSLSHGYFPSITRWDDPELERSLEPSGDTDTASRGRSSLSSSRASSRGSSPTHSQVGKSTLRLPKALTRMAQQLAVTATPSSRQTVPSSSPSIGNSNNFQTSITLPSEAEHENPSGTCQDNPTSEVLSRVPSYTVASLGSLGGGPVPISSLIDLPAYEDSVHVSQDPNESFKERNES